MQISLFGGVRVIAGDGEPLDVGPPKSQAVLAALALSAGSAVPVPRLVEQVWGEEPPRTAEKTLQWYVAQLRKSLGTGVIARVGVAYRLDVPGDAVDVVRFRRHLDAGDVDAALREWTGAPLAGLDLAGLAPAVDGLVERWLDATERSLELVIDADPGGAVGPLTELTAQHPFREGLWALLMSALHRSGRQAEALATFRRARDLLIDELGVEPGGRLRELEAQVLSGGDPDAQGDRAPSKVAAAPGGSKEPAEIQNTPPLLGSGSLPAPLGDSSAATPSSPPRQLH